MSVFIGYPSFMAYQMMKGKKGNNDGFPSIPGMIARYSALGLTNEQMAANPVWVDKTGNGHDLQMKNFAWGGMSGVGGIPTDRGKYEFTLDDYYMMAVSSGTQHAQFTFKVTGLVDGNTLSLADTSSPSNVYGKWTQDGIYTVDIDVINTDRSLYFYNGVSATRGEFTIEILPLYPGFILGDGVDDEAVTKNNLDLEDTYTVYTPLILLKYGGVVCGKSAAKDYSLNTVISSKSIGFDSANAWSGSIPVDLYKFVLVVCKRNSKTMYVKDLITGKSNQSNSKEFVSNPGKYFIWRNTGGSWSQVAIAGQIICNGYYSTDEDDEKVLDWYKKQYPWLFFDQAWTVTGKTNEDEDRATIANITGNGNNLVLSNFGFAEGSGYGLYAYNFNSFGLRDNVVKPTDVKKDSFRIIGIGNNSNVLVLSNTSNSAAWKIRITGMKEGDSCIVGNANKSGDYIKIIKDGTYTFQKQYAATSINGIWYNSSQEVDVLVEQIPEYEGYLVTDGVDDQIRSSAITMGKDFTVVTESIFIQPTENNVTGVVKPNSFSLYNYIAGVNTYINRTGTGYLIRDTRSIKAFSSDGRLYSDDWSEHIDNIEQTVSSSVGGLTVGYSTYGADYTKLAFKNLAIYPTVLSEEDCIKAYNYLQTLKAK